MKIVVITGSPHKAGTSALLAEKFISGANASGNEVFCFQAAFQNVHPCIGCEKCQCGKSPCVFHDGMSDLAPKLKEANVVAFVSPVYYHDVSAQLKTVIDRFHGIEISLQNSPKQAVILLTAAASDPDVAAGALAVHQRTLRHLNWQDRGHIVAVSCNMREDIKRTDYPEQAYLMGKSFK